MQNVLAGRFKSCCRSIFVDNATGTDMRSVHFVSALCIQDGTGVDGQQHGARPEHMRSEEASMLSLVV